MGFYKRLSFWHLHKNLRRAVICCLLWGNIWNGSLRPGVFSIHHITRTILVTHRGSQLEHQYLVFQPDHHKQSTALPAFTIQNWNSEKWGSIMEIPYHNTMCGLTKHRESQCLPTTWEFSFPCSRLLSSRDNRQQGKRMKSSFNFCAWSLFAPNYHLSKQFTQVLAFSWDKQVHKDMAKHIALDAEVTQSPLSSTQGRNCSRYFDLSVAWSQLPLTMSDTLLALLRFKDLKFMPVSAG